jgi:hypothetical protein
VSLFHPWRRRHEQAVAEEQRQLGAARRALAESDERLKETQSEVIEPLRELRNRNNVAAMARSLLRPPVRPGDRTGERRTGGTAEQE